VKAGHPGLREAQPFKATACYSTVKATSGIIRTCELRNKEQDATQPHPPKNTAGCRTLWT